MGRAYRAIVLSLVASACLFLPPSSHADSASPRDHSVIEFVVASCTSDGLLPDVRITMLTVDGTETEYGATDSSGKWSISKAFLRAQQVRYLLFSHARFSTGAIRVDDALLSQDRHGIDLAPQVVY